MPLDKKDLQQIKGAAVEAMLADHKERIEKLEGEVKELKELLLIR